MKTQLFYCLAFLLMYTTLCGQVLIVNSNMHISIQANTIINGKLYATEESELSNEGKLYVESDLTNDGICSGGPTGVFHIQGNWTNNAVFSADSCLVIMDQNDQSINGTFTAFHQLQLSEGQKYLLTDISADHLDMNATHIATLEHSLSITNPDPSAIVTDGSWISSEEGGALIRYMNTTEAYLFPVGSSLQDDRYRPVQLSPRSVEEGVMSVRMVNHSPSMDGMDREQHSAAVRDINNLYYHLIGRTEGTDPLDVTFFYLPEDMGAETVGHWDNNNWKLQFNTQNESGSMRMITTLEVADFTSPAFALSTLDAQFYIPNSFTPGDDGINDFFSIAPANPDDITDFRFLIFNRWGEVVFETSDPRFHWAGGDVYYPATTTFNWQLQYRQVKSAELITSSGCLTLLR